MSTDKRSFTDDLREVAQSARHQAGPGPSPEELVAYVLGELEPAAAARLRERLSVDREAAESVLDLHALARLETRGPEPADLDETVPSWDSIQERLQREESAPAQADPTPQPAVIDDTVATLPAGGGTAYFVKLLPRLAALFLLVLGVAWMLRLTAPSVIPGSDSGHVEINVAVAAEPILPLEQTRGGGGSLAPDTEGRLPLSLALPISGETYSEYRLKVERLDGVELRAVPGLRPLDDGTLGLRLPAGWLAAGRYRLQLEGVGSRPAETTGSAETVASYEIEIPAEEP